MICENCRIEHNGIYGSSRFCSQKCARGFSTKFRRTEINEKVSSKLKGRLPKSAGWQIPKYLKSLGGRNGSKSRKSKNDTLLRTLSWNELLPIFSVRTLANRIIKNEQKSECSSCHLSKWLEKEIVLELHHIDGNKFNNSRSNLTMLCPNCHSQTDNWKSKNHR